jgi:hypothetical protein
MLRPPRMSTLYECMGTRDGVRKLRKPEDVADVGESAETPLILLGEVPFVAAIAVLVVLALALVAYRLAA